MALSDTGWEGMDWTDLAQDTKKVVYCFKLCTEPMGSTKYGKFLNSSKIYWLLQTASALCQWLVGSLVGRLFGYVFSQCGNIPSKEKTFI